MTEPTAVPPAEVKDFKSEGPKEVDMSKKFSLVLMLDLESNSLQVNGKISDVKDALASLAMANHAVMMWNILNTGYLLPQFVANGLQNWLIKNAPKPDHKKPAGAFGGKK